MTQGPEHYAAVRLLRLGGVYIEAHASLLLVPIAAALLSGARGTGWGSQTGINVFLAIGLLYLSVLAHEWGHVLAARFVGLDALRIILYPFGGAVELNTSLSQPKQELLIALGGPAVNLVFAAVSLAALGVFQQSVLGTGAQVMLLCNAALFGSNMLPLLPLDGGRAVRAALAPGWGYAAATHLMTRLSIMLAGAAGLGGGMLWLAGWPAAGLALLLSVTVGFGAQEENRGVLRKRALLEGQIGVLCHMPARALAPWDAVDPALIRHMLRNNLSLLVLRDGAVVGILVHSDLLPHAWRPKKLTAAHLMRTRFATLSAHESLWTAYLEMLKADVELLPVRDSAGHFIGIISVDDLHKRQLNAIEGHKKSRIFPGPV